MARNEEKQLGRLNRLWLKQLSDECKEKNPPRPKLSSLNTAEDLKKWLPSIKRDIDFCLKQSQVGCYPQRKIDEYNQQIDQLQREYRAFVRKLREKDPDTKVIPWVERSYQKNKRSRSCSPDNKDEKKAKTQEVSVTEGTKSENQVTDIMTDFTPINTPILDQSYIDMYGYEGTKPAVDMNCNPEFQDQPLQFVSDKSTDQNDEKSAESTSSLNLPYSDSSDSEPD